MQQYLDALSYVLKHGDREPNRTGIDTLSVFPYPESLAFNLADGFPLMTTKQMFFKGIAVELLWFISGETNIRPLVKQGVHIWNDWPYAKFQKSSAYSGETIQEFVRHILESDSFANTWGDLGPVYGKQWRNFNGVDQLEEVIKNISSVKENPMHSMRRRLIVSAWNPGAISDMALPPCHMMYIFNVSNGKLNLDMTMRSVDMFLGLPFNIASYALLLTMVAQVCNLEPGNLTLSLKDAHIYVNHIEAVKTQLERKPYRLPTITLFPKANMDEFVIDDIMLNGYKHHPKITAPIAV